MHTIQLMKKEQQFCLQYRLWFLINPLDYAFEIENFKERLMNNTPMQDRGKPQKLSNQYVINSGAVPHQRRRIEQLTRKLLMRHHC